MTGNSLLIIAMFMAFASAVLGLTADKFPNDWKGTVLLTAALMALVSGILNFYGTKRTEDESKKETDILYKNYVNDLKEAFGLMSYRTAEQFLAEKVPANLSSNETLQLVEKVVTKYLQDSLMSREIRTDQEAKLKYEPKLLWNESDTSTAGYWTIGNLRFRINVKLKGQNTMTYWDCYTERSSGPNDYKYIHVLVDDGSKITTSFFNDKLTEKTRDLIYKYSKWYEAIRPHQSTHTTHEHIILVAVKDKNKDMEVLLDEMKLWIGHQRGGRFNLDPTLIYYDIDELNKINSILSTK